MTRPDDALALYIILAIVMYLIVRNWLPTTFSKWVKRSSGDKDKKEVTIPGRIPDYLRSQGYEVTEKNVKVPLAIDLEYAESDEEKSYESRLFIDYIASKEEQTYLVFLEREKKPLQLTGPQLRERFLSPYLIYRPAGILFIKKDKQVLHFDLEVPDKTTSKKTTHWYYLIFFILGLAISWFAQ